MVPDHVAKLLPHLAPSSLFKGLTQAELTTVCQFAYLRKVERQTFFFHEGEQAQTFYILTRGRARLQQVTPAGHQVIVRYVGPGDGVGIIVVLSDMNYPVSCEAVEDCETLAWDKESFTHLVHQMPQLAVNGMELVARRFAMLQNQYRELATERVEQRVARAILRLVRQAGKRVPEGVLIDMPLSRQDLAEMTGTTLYTVSRILSNWEQQGLVQTGRERVILTRSHELVVIAEDLPRKEEGN